MGKSIKLKVRSFATVLGGRRHQGRHRCGPTSADERRCGRDAMSSGQPQAPTVGQTNQDTCSTDFYVVFPNLPARRSNLGS
jgi:hypothetical protein